MRNKNGIVFLTVIVTLLCVFYLSFTFIASRIEGQADEFARGTDGNVNYFKKQEYLDSLWNEPVFNFLGIKKFTYKEVKENELNLGLDLKGGMHVTLEVSPADIIIALSGDNEDPKFREAVKAAGEMQKESQAKFTTLFFNAFEELAPNTPLAEVFSTSANREKIGFDTPDKEVRKVIDAEVDGAMNRAYEIIKTRVDKFGVSQPNIQRIQGTGRIQIELPGVDNPSRVRKLLQGVAKLEFLEVFTPQEYGPYLDKINTLLVKRQKANEKLNGTAAEPEGTVAEGGQLFSDNVEETLSTDTTQGELFEGQTAQSDSAAQADSLMNALQSQMSDLYRLAKGGLSYEDRDTSKINRIFHDPEVKAILPPDMKFLWNMKPNEGQDGQLTNIYQLNVVKIGRGGKAPLTGEVVDDARHSFDEYGRPSVSMSMNVTGAREWKRLTGKNIGRQVAIVLDELVCTAPVVNQEIPSGSSEISGNFTVEEAKDLANILKAGKLPAPTRIVEEVVVGPSLGVQAQQQGIVSILVGLGLVVLFMVLYYAKGGFIANIALIINVFFIFGILAQFNAALTLPGIAGIVLTIGMSIDANVLIFERIREELRKDEKNLLNAIKLGYEKAFSTIFDSNLTTLLTGVFLYTFGSGPIKGFAVTLIIGIVCSFFSAVFITRVIVTWMTKKGNESNLSFVTPFSKRILSSSNFDFLSKRKTAYFSSAAVIIVGVVLIVTQGLNLGVDFEGGRTYVVQFSHDVVPSKMEVALKKNLGEAGLDIKTFGNSQTVKITTNYMVDDESTETDELVMSEVVKGIEAFTGDKFVANQEAVKEGTFMIPSTAKVGATIADDIAKASETAGVFSLIAIFIYIWVRFRRWRFGLGAVAALFHDSLVVFSAFAIARVLGFSFEIDQVFVAAILTIIGYSINDTVVVFDRVRENIQLGGEESHLKDLLNKSVNQTLNRTLITSFTTLLVVFILFLFGGEVLRGFSYALLVGIIVGTYSSIFVATPIVYDTTLLYHKQQAKKQKEKAA
ncbi:protein translocase subunit SecDF [Rapidithrix thailandica]|uniref:Multifunctional fusion protein n=1 Tax=Rapidithrix thailandica TaxID=413964 RepID=A0AAW9SF71_9BACT